MNLGSARGGKTLSIEERSTKMNRQINYSHRLAAVAIMAGLAVTLTANGDTIGAWPSSQPYLWSTNPFSPVCGTVSLQALDTLQMGSYGSGSKNAWWLPYGSLNGSAWAERLCVAKLLNGASAPVTNIHVKLLDQRGASGNNGWAVIFRDGAGRLLDFGVRPFYRSAYIMAHEWDGTNWVNWAGSDFFTPYYERSTVNPAYYTIDFIQNADGTLTWTIACSDATALDFPATNTTSIAYGSITEFYLSASTPATASVNYKWTEFSVVPQVYSPPTLGMTRSGGDLDFSWPSPWNNFVLQANPDLNTTTWTNLPDATNDDGTNVTVTIPIGPGNLFYRLAQ